MKKIYYLFAIIGLFIFTACSNSSKNTTGDKAVEIATCGYTGEPCLDDHSCCIPKEEKETQDSTL
jgi:hypothetical protein